MKRIALILLSILSIQLYAVDCDTISLDITANIAHETNELSNASIDVFVSTNSGGLRYLWPDDSSTFQLRENLSAGNYKVEITDELGCTNDSTFVITNSITNPCYNTSLSVYSTITNKSENDSIDGSIRLYVTGGTEPYSYLWSNDSTTKDIDGLDEGTYYLTVTDSNNCEASYGYVVENSDEEEVWWESSPGHYVRIYPVSENIPVISFQERGLAVDTLTIGLVAYYPLDGNAMDYSGNGNHATDVEASLDTNFYETSNSAYRFNDGTMKFNLSEFREPYNEITISMWFKSDSSYNYLISQSSSGFYVRQNSPSAIFFRSTFLNPDGILYNTKYSDLSLDWHFFAVTLGNDSVRIMLDDSLYSNTYITGDINIDDFFIPGSLGFTNTNSYLKGKLDDIRVYNRWLSGDELLSIYNIGASTSTPELLSTVYVSPNGSDNNVGTQQYPFKTIMNAIDFMNDTIFVESGTYDMSINSYSNTTGVTLNNDGTDVSKNYLIGDVNNKPILDFSNLEQTSDNIGIDVTSNYWNILNLELINAKQYSGSQLARGLRINDGNNNTIENVESHEHGGFGFVITGVSTNNYFINCDSYNNYDYLTTGYSGGNADGFRVSPDNTSKTINTFIGCRSWNNSDDGWDVWYNNGLVILDSCWAFWNGYKPDSFEPSGGDGQGFKIGQLELEPQDTILRKISNSLAAQNLVHGYDKNTGVLTSSRSEIINSTFYNNGGIGVTLTDTIINTLTNNISYLNVSSDTLGLAASTQTNNDWQLPYTMTNNDFISMDSTSLLHDRNFNGKLPDIDFLKVKSTSDYSGLGYSNN